MEKGMSGVMVDVEVHGAEAADELNQRCSGCHARVWSICSQLKPEQQNELARYSSQFRLSKNDILFEDGVPVEYVFTVISGALKLYRNLPDGQRQIVGFPYPGDFLDCDIAHKYDFSAEALTETVLCRTSKVDFAGLVEKSPDVERGVLRKTCQALSHARSHMLQLGRATALQRVASLLVELADRPDQGTNSVIRLPMSRADIADYLGLTVETVSRSFTALRKMELIDLDTVANVHLLAPRRLRLMAEGKDGFE